MTQHNFGYETIGTGYYSSIEDYITGSVFTITEAGTADSITVALKYLTSAWTGKAKCAIYKHSDLSLVGATDERTITVTNTYVWYTFNFSVKPSLTANENYILVVWGQSAAGGVRTPYDAGSADQMHYQSIVYGDFPNPLVPTHVANKVSIYCTYTVGGAPPPAGGVLAQVM
jgi:hypothetical protein